MTPPSEPWDASYPASSPSFYPSSELEDWSYSPAPSSARTITKLVPYRLRKVGPEGGEQEHAGPASKLTRDERAAMALRLPFSVQAIIQYSMEEFAEMINSW